ncbi:MAG TPA: hypothetical protein VGA58_02590 [bacterium]
MRSTHANNLSWRTLGADGRTVVRGVLGAIRQRSGVFVLVVVAIVALNLILPPLVLSVARKPYDHFSFNPWLHNVPSWLRSGEATLGRKVDFLWNAAVLWFIASSEYDEAEWGFTVTVRDVARWVLMGALFGAYFSVWLQRRSQLKHAGLTAGRRGGRGGVAGSVLSTLGVTTMPCSVTGCGAPVLPVVGLALTGLSSGTIALMSNASRVLVWIVIAGVTASIIVLAKQVSEGSLSPAARL